MKTERELFEEWLKNTNKNLYDLSKDFIDDDSKESLCFQWAWTAWQASAQREGYKLVPVNPTKEMYLAGTHELTQIDFRDLHDNDSIQVYKAMIGAAP